MHFVLHKRTAFCNCYSLYSNGPHSRVRGVCCVRNEGVLCEGCMLCEGCVLCEG